MDSGRPAHRVADDNLEIAQMASERQQRASLERRRSADRGAPVRFIVDVEICTTRTTKLNKLHPTRYIGGTH